MQINVDMIYPVGSIYITMSTINPSTLFGGTWSKIEGKFLLGTNDSYTLGSTGGEATHTLTAVEMPSHCHGAYSSDNSTFMNYDRSSSTAVSRHQIAIGSSGWYAFCAENTKGNGVASNYTTGYTGSGTAHNNMPPYMAVNIWQRTA